VEKIDSYGVRRHRELAGLGELREVLGWEVEGDVGVAALEQRPPVAGGGHLAHDHLLDPRQRA
jgi:hypothetical protein